jgi:hypothetical protein
MKGWAPQQGVHMEACCRRAATVGWHVNAGDCAQPESLTQVGGGSGVVAQLAPRSANTAAGASAYNNGDSFPSCFRDYRQNSSGSRSLSGSSMSRT